MGSSLYGGSVGQTEVGLSTRTLRNGSTGLRRCSASLLGSSVKGTWRGDSLNRDPEGYLEKTLETGISFHRGSAFEEPGGGLIYREL